MANEATAVCKYLEAELKEEIESSGISIDWDALSGEDSIHISFSSQLEKLLRDIPIENKRHLIKNAEFRDRIKDLLRKNKEQKIASIRWFGEQEEQGYLDVLETFEKDEEDVEIKSAIKKAMLRLTERLNPNKPQKIKMRVRMKGKGQPLPVDEEDILLDDNDVYISHVKTSVKVKMKVRMKGKGKPLSVDEDDIIFLYD